jgi:hypothetical protein
MGMTWVEWGALSDPEQEYWKGAYRALYGDKKT